MTRPAYQSRSRSGFTRLQWPSTNFPHGIQFIFKDYSYGQFVSGSRLGNLNSDRNLDSSGADTVWTTAENRRTTAEEKGSFVLELPIPKTLTDSTGVQVSGFERSFIEAFLSQQAVSVASNPMAAAKSIGNAIAAAAGGVVSGDFGGLFGSDAKGTENAAAFKRLIGTIGTSVLGTLGLGEKSIGAIMGSTTNPLTTLHFGGVDLRSFTFNWQLFPSSAQEAKDIRDIVRKVKSKILPKVQSLKPTGSAAALGNLAASSFGRAYLEYPSVVFINLLGVDESHFPKFKVCMCSNISIDYAENGSIPTIAEGGVPMGINLAMSFSELEIQTAEDYSVENGKSFDLDVKADSANTNSESSAGSSSSAGLGGSF